MFARPPVAEVGMLAGRLGSHDGKVPTGLDEFVSGACGQNHRIAGCNLNAGAVRSPELHLC